MQIQQLITLGESKTLEFKQDASSLMPIIKTIIAFANTAGGILIIGVTDSKQIMGVSHPEAVQDQIANAIAVSISPQLLVDITPVNHDGKIVILVQVQSGFGPYFIKSEGIDKGTYTRLGATTRIATSEIIAEIQREAKHLHYDAQPCFGTTFDDLEQKLMRTYFKQINKKSSIKNMLSLGVLIAKGDQLIPSNGGMIVFGKKDKRLQLFRNTFIGCARFQGTNKAIFIDKVELDCDLITAVEEVSKFIQRNTRTRVEFMGMRRKESPEYSPFVFREIIINAFVHANYEVLDSRFLVGVFDDRIEINSPGVLPITMTVEQLRAGVSRVRNSVIARVFKEYGLIEQWGSCYGRIHAICLKEDCPEPKWEEFSAQMRVTIYPPRHDPNMIPDRAHVGIMSGLSSEQIVLLEYATAPRSLAELMEKLQLKHRVKFAAKYVHPLIELALLTRTIPDKPKSINQRYVITSKGQIFLQEQQKHV